MIQISENFFNLYNAIRPIITYLKSLGATSYLVGGSVRDLILHQTIKDWDIEVHAIDEKILEKGLSRFGKVLTIGKFFGVLRITDLSIDWSLPRVDSIGRKPIIKIDPYLGIKKACRRRDLTINAMAIDLNNLLNQLPNVWHENLYSTIIDPYNGIKDISYKLLRAVDENLFIQDPLRFYRVMQFAGRFEMHTDQQLTKICSTMSLIDPQTKKPIAAERVYDEIKKLLLYSKKPSIGFQWLLDINRLQEIFPELFTLTHNKDTYGNSLFFYTMQIIDAVKKKIKTANDLPIILASLAIYLPDKKSIKTLLTRCTNNIQHINTALALAIHNTLPQELIKTKASLGIYKQYAFDISPGITYRQLLLIAYTKASIIVDKQIRIMNQKQCLDSFYVAKKAKILDGPEKPLLQGKDLLFMIKPGPELGSLLKKAYAIQIHEGISSINALLNRLK